MTDYRPIDCGLYSRYEVAILEGRARRFGWRDETGRSHLGVLRPRDLVTRAHAEYLVAETADGERLELRLDRIDYME